MRTSLLVALLLVATIGCGGASRSAAGGEQRARGAVGLLGDRDAELILQLGRDLADHCAVPAAHEDRGHRGDAGVEARLDAPLDPSQVGVGSREVVLAREEQGHVDGDAGKDGLLDGGQTLGGPGDLDEEVRPGGPGEEIPGSSERPGGVEGEERGDLE